MRLFGLARARRHCTLTKFLRQFQSCPMLIRINIINILNMISCKSRPVASRTEVTGQTLTIDHAIVLELFPQLDQMITINFAVNYPSPDFNIFSLTILWYLKTSSKDIEVR